MAIYLLLDSRDCYIRTFKMPAKKSYVTDLVMSLSRGSLLNLLNLIRTAAIMYINVNVHYSTFGGARYKYSHNKKRVLRFLTRTKKTHNEYYNFMLTTVIIIITIPLRASIPTLGRHI